MSTPTHRTAAAGFTVIELMITLAVLAILISVAAPGLNSFIMNMRLTGQANDLLTDLMLARSEATKRDVRVAVCAARNITRGDSKKNADADCTNGNKWEDGWLVVIDADGDGDKDGGTEPLKIVEPLSGSNTIRNSGKGPKGAIVFTPAGYNASGESVFTICDPRSKGRAVTVSPTGRAFVTKLETCGTGNGK